MEEAPSIEKTRGDIHTLKGAADTFQLVELAQELHGLETDIDENAPRFMEIVKEHRPALMSAFNNSMALAREILGNDFESFGEIRAIQ